MAKVFVQKYNPGCNFNGLGQQADSSSKKNKKQKILDFLEKSKIPLFPKEIADKLGLNHSTVKSYLRILAKEGFIKRLEGGRYCSNATYGVVKPLLIHNLRFKIEAPYLRDMEKIPDDDEFYGDVHLWIQYGRRHGLITGGIAYDKGLDQAHVLLLMRRIYELVERKTGHKVERFRITTLEWNRDFVGKRIDNREGIRCFTIGEFEHYLSRLYQKSEHTVRVEVKTNRELTLDELLEIQRTGSIGYLRDGEILNQIFERLDALTLAVKFQNRKISDLEAKLDVLADSLETTIKALNNLVESENRLMESQKQLTEPLTRLANLVESQTEAFKKRKRPSWMV